MSKTRKIVNKNVDKKIFRNTANKIEKKNLDALYSKGGIRLWQILTNI